MTTDLRQGQAPAQSADFDENRLLRTFPETLRLSLMGQAAILRLDDGDVLHEVGADVDRSLFPLGPAMISLSTETPVLVDRSPLAPLIDAPVARV